MEKSRFILKRNVYVSLRDCHKLVSLKSIHTKYIFLIAQEILLLCFGLLKKSSQEEVSQIICSDQSGVVGPGYNSSRYIFRLSQRLASRLWRSTGIRGSTHFYYIWKCSFFVSDKQTGLHKLWHPSIRDTSMWSKFGAHGEHGDVFPFSNLGAL